MAVTITGDESNLCKKHFEMRNKIEEKRDRSDRDHKEYESRSETKTMRKEYRKDHPEVSYKGYTSFRARKMKEDPVAYRAKQAEYAKKFRKNNPEKVKETASIRKYDVNAAFAYYCRQADMRGYEFELNPEQFNEIVKDDCYFCDYRDEKILNGIDRLDNDLPYTEDNVVTCCKTCNFMKNTLNESTFILMCSHITAYNRLWKKAKEYPKVFNNHTSVSYKKSISSEKSRNIKFILSNILLTPHPNILF